jgi:hypothetical protein
MLFRFSAPEIFVLYGLPNCEIIFRDCPVLLCYDSLPSRHIEFSNWIRISSDPAANDTQLRTKFS